MIPQLSELEQKDRWSRLQKNTIVPLSTQWAQTVSGSTYATVDASGLGQYDTNQISQKTAYGLVGIRLTNFLKTITDGIVIVVSYLPTFTLAAGAGTSVPDDAGNIIYRAVLTAASFNETFLIKAGPSHDNFFVEANRIVYVHQWASTAAIAAASMTAQGFLTLYAEFTGIRT